MHILAIRASRKVRRNRGSLPRRTGSHAMPQSDISVALRGHPMADGQRAHIPEILVDTHWAAGRKIQLRHRTPFRLTSCGGHAVPVRFKGGSQ